MGDSVVVPKKYVGRGAVTIQSSLDRSSNGLTQLEHIVGKHLTEVEKKLLAPELKAFKAVLTELGANPQDKKALDAALKQSTDLTKHIGALLNKTTALSDIVDKTSSKGITPRIAVVSHEFRDASEGLKRGLEYMNANMSDARVFARIMATKASTATADGMASAEALKPAKLELIKGGDYRLIYDATNLQGNSHQVVSELRVAAERQGITARASYHTVGNKSELTVVFDGTAKAGKFLRVNEATALFVDTANLLADSAQKYAALGQEKLAAEYLRKANQYNPIADYKPANFPAVASSDAERVKIATELKSLRETLKVNRGEFAQLTKAERLEYIPKAVTEVAGASSEASPLMLAKATSRGWPRLLGTAGGYALLLEGLVAATGAVSDKLHQADLKDALEAQARLNYARTHQNLRNDDAIRDVEFNR